MPWKGAALPLYELTKLLGEPAGYAEEAALMRAGRIGHPPGPVAVILRARTELPAGVDDLLVLYTFDSSGKKVAQKVIASNSANEAASRTDTVTVGPGGTLDVATLNTWPLHDVAGLEALTGTARTTVRIGLDGTVALEEAADAAGRFDDPASKEVLLISLAKKKVVYRGTWEKPAQDLVVVAFDPKAGTASVAFSSAKAKVYKLVWSPTHDALVCTDPDGKAQTFKRVW